MSDNLLYFFALIIPMILLMAFAVFILTRSHQIFASRMTAYISFCYASGFLCEYLRHIVSEEWSYVFERLLILFCFLGLTMALHSLYNVLERKLQRKIKLLPHLFYLPFLSYGLIAIFGPTPDTQGYKRMNGWLFTPLDTVSLFGYVTGSLLIVVILGVLIVGLVNSKASNYRKMYKLFLRWMPFIVLLVVASYLAYLLGIIPFTLQLLIPTTFSVILTAISMYRYGVAPSYAGRYQLMLDLTPIPVIVYNEKLILKEFNELALKMIPNLHVGMHLSELYDDADNKAKNMLMIQTLRLEKNVFDYPITYYEGTDREAHIEVNGAYIKVGHEALYYLMFQNVTKEVKQRQQSHYLAYHDSLTKLFNRSYIVPTVNQLIGNDPEQPAALILCDLNYFKNINDTYGHLIGDEVLQFVADCLKLVVKDYAIPARLGGDEFVVFSAHTMPEFVEKKILRPLEQKFATTCFEKDDLKLGIQMSIGVAYYPQDGKNFEELFHHADIRMYEHKAKMKKMQGE